MGKIKNLLSISDFNSTERRFAIHFLISRFWALGSIWIIFLTERGLSLAEVALIDIVFWGSMFVFEIPTGVIADKFGRKISLIISFITQAFGIFIFAYAPNLNWFLISYFVWGLGLTLQSGAEEAWIFDEISINYKNQEKEAQDRYQHVFGILLSLSLISAATALVTGGFLAEYSLRWPVLLTGGIFCFNVLWLIIIPENGFSQDQSKQSTAKNTKNAIKEIFSPVLLPLVTIVVLIGGITTAIVFWVQPYLDTKDIAYSNIGIILGTGILFMSFGSAINNEFVKRFGKYTLGILIFVMGTLLMLFSVIRLEILIPLFFILRIFRGAFSPYVSRLLNEKIDTANRATSLSIVGAMITISVMLFEIGTALLIEEFSYELSFFISGLLILIFVLPLAMLYTNSKSLFDNIHVPLKVQV
ncbi:MAG: MFS transporter [Candidatus Kariarchaeaceae archaeon]|jgi:MFS family permease